MAYAFLDKYGILHLHESETVAKREAAGKVVEKDIKNDNGYPVVGSKKIVYYSAEDKAYVDGNKKEGTLIATPSAIRDLVNQLK